MPTPRLTQDDFLRLLLQNEREIKRYVMAIVPHAADAQEIVQETAVALWNKIDSYDPSQSFAPWACRFAANKAKEHLRKTGRWKGFLDDDVANLLLNRRMETTETLDRRMEPLRDCVGELPNVNRQLIEGYYFEQRSIEQLAARIERSVDAVYKSLQRIRGALLDCVNGKLESAETPS